MRTIEDIDTEINKLKSERDSIIKENKMKSIMEYKNSIDLPKVEEFYSAYNNLCKEYGYSIGEISVGYASIRAVIKTLDGKPVAMLNNGRIQELPDSYIEDILF